MSITLFLKINNKKKILIFKRIPFETVFCSQYYLRIYCLPEIVHLNYRPSFVSSSNIKRIFTFNKIQLLQFYCCQRYRYYNSIRSHGRKKKKNVSSTKYRYMQRIILEFIFRT